MPPQSVLPPGQPEAVLDEEDALVDEVLEEDDAALEEEAIDDDAEDEALVDDEADPPPSLAPASGTGALEAVVEPDDVAPDVDVVAPLLVPGEGQPTQLP